MNIKKATILLSLVGAIFANNIFAANKIGDSPFASITATLPFGQHLLTNTPYVAHYNVHVVNGFSVLWNPPGHPSLPPMVKVAPGTTCPNINDAASNVSINSDCQLNLSFTATKPMTQGIHGGPWVYFGSGQINPDQPINIQDVALSPANLSVTEDTSQEHLSYKKLIVRNIGNSQVVLGNIVSSIPDKVAVCGTTGANSNDCFYHSTCETGTALAMHTGSCYIWIQAKEDTNSPIAVRNTAGAITINATPVALQNRAQVPPPVVVHVNYNQDLYVGGSFDKTADNNTTLNNIARWDGSNWHPVGVQGHIPGLGVPATNDSVDALLTTEGDLYVGGDFAKTADNNTTLNSIARWDGRTWHQLGNPTSSPGLLITPSAHGIVYALATLNNNLYVGGLFKNAADGTILHNITRWDGHNWQKLGNPLNPGLGSVVPFDDVDALAVFNGKLYVGGFFEKTADNATTLNNITCWDGSTWQQLGSPTPGLGQQPPLFLEGVSAITPFKGNLYVGGFFKYDANNNLLNHITYWDGSNWKQLGSASHPGIGKNHPLARAIILTATQNNLYVGGLFEKAVDNTLLNNITRWDGSNWNQLGGATNPGLGIPANFDFVSSLVAFGNSVYIGGLFAAANDSTPLENITNWNGGLWQKLGSNPPGLSGHVTTLAIVPSVAIS